MSVQNQIKGEIIKIEEGDVLSRVYLSTIIGTISSLISSTSLHRLNLQLNEEACAFIKTNELILNELASPTHHL
ncbi:hypothetical protein NH26_01685 [Flammeovirga pacifica]|uniref:Transport-associated OB type 1 domain-containing protein n=1 Tax=Flammeovirga pacifica TaxID=915059 RepID=A0A1S1Z540_FLAPC|nr:hypothetical protein NH26_01685 [Flammeovirga pacifica]